VNDELPLFPSVDLWDWHMVTEPDSKGQPMTRLVGRLTRGSSKLHPSLPARGGLLRTAPVREVHLDLVRVSSGKLYRLRNPSRKYLASLSALLHVVCLMLLMNLLPGKVFQLLVARSTR
uniref:Uncharacterized protein n=1 Tax=Aegilops tauschii subsp. strangulata TaxID=200361 RepID=A0A453E2X8_AEGTS